MKLALRLLLGLLVLVVVVVAGGLGYLATLSPDDIKRELVEALRAETGHELTLDGPLEFGLWPKIRLTAGPLAISNAADFGDQPLLAAERIEVAVATLPLLRQRVEMDTVVLHGLRLNLARNAAGATNLDRLLKGKQGQDARGGDSLAALILGGVDIQDAQITWLDAQSGQEVSISRLAITTGALTLGTPVAFKLTMTALANQPAFDGDITLDGTVAYDLANAHYVIAPLAFNAALRGAHLSGGQADVTLGAAIDLDLGAGTATVSDLKLNGLGTTATGGFKASGLDADRPSASGSLALAGEDLARIFSAFKLPVGKQVAAVADRRFTFDLAFDADMESGKVVVSQFDGQLLGATVNGRFSATEAHTDKPVASGSLNASGPDLPLLVAVIGTLNGASAGALKSLATAFAGAGDKSFTLAADLDVDLAKGLAALPKLEAKLLGNSISGAIHARNAGTPEPAFKGTLTASGPDLPSLLAVASGLQTDGKALRDMARRLAGEADKRFSLSAEFDSDLASGRIDVPTLAADLLGVHLSGGIQGQNIDVAKGSGTLDGRLKAEGKDIGPLLRGLGQADLAKSLRTLNVDAGIQGALSALVIAPLEISTTVQRSGGGEAVALRMTAGSAQADLGRETLSLKGVSITGLGLNARADIEAEQIKSQPRFHGTLDVPAFDLRTLLTSLSQPLPTTADPKALSKIALKSTISGSASSVALADLRAVVDDTTITGRAEVLNFSGPDLAFDLKVDTLNADRYLEPRAAGEARAATPEAAAAGAASELPVETLRALTLDGALVVGELVLSGAQMKNVKLVVKASGGRIRAEPLAAELYGGRYDGVIALDATGAEVLLDLRTRLDQVNVEPLLKDTVQNDTLAGVVSFEAALTATGGSSERLQQTLAGNGRFTTTNGVFRGVDAVAVLRTVEQIIECKCVLAVPKGGETRFTTLGGTLTADRGVIRNEDLVLAGEGFNMAGKGMLANLHDHTLKYDLKLAVDATRTTSASANYNLGGYSVPVQCRGQIDEPSCLPDLGDIVKQVATAAAKKKVEEAIGKKLEDAVGGEAGEALKKLFKF